ncbi:unnamed protein product [Leuciscus chuanchicus]
MVYVHCSNILYPFVRAKPDRFPLSALGIHHKAPACHSSVQSGSVLFYHKLFPYASSHRRLMRVRRLRDRQASCLPQPPLSVKSADSTEAVTLVMEGLLGMRTCVQQPCGFERREIGVTLPAPGAGPEPWLISTWFSPDLELLSAGNQQPDPLVA